MPSRMSLRRTKQRQSYYRNLSSSSQSNSLNQRAEHQDVPNLTQEQKIPKYKGTETILKDIENTLLSPVKLIEQGFREKAKSLGAAESVIEPKVLEKLRHKFRKPKPLSEKRKIVDGILEDLVSDIIIQKKPKTKEPVRAWFSPKKDTTKITEENQLPPLDTKEPETNKNLEESKSKPQTSENDITKSNDVIIDNPASSFELPSSIETIDTSPPDDIAIDNAADNSENESVAGRRILRRTKQRQSYYRNSSTSSQINSSSESKPEQQDLPTLESSREELNLKTPKRYTKAAERSSKDIENTMLSPVTLIEQGFRESIESLGTDKLEIAPNVLEKLRHRFRKPKPMSRKRKIMDGILEDLVNDAMEQNKTQTKEPASPLKDAIDITTEDQEPKLESPQREIQQESLTNTSLEKSNTESLQTENSPDTEGQKSNEVIDIDTDDDSRSTFELPPEFIADDSNSVPIFDTPKKLKTVEIQKDSSMEISEDNNVINIDLVQIENANDVVLKFTNVKSPAKNEFCAFKFSPRDKESLEENTVDIDLESFKSQYLNEVDRDFKCTFSHKHSDCNSNSSTIKLKTAIDFALEAASKEKKVKIKSKKKSKRSEGPEERKSKKNQKRKRLKLVYVWKSDPTLNLSPSKSEPQKTLKQYVLKYADKKSGEVIGKPEKDVTPIKKKHFKNERSPDNLIQTSIQSFFKLKSNEK
ncbi:uncharacterized protein LOC114365409 [Ostrinia furnacalis]|uniref:uncharacterized protein LOC114365409 n=1 Tax=Ostrinia furnacalis TaxID=93504 RepID=UPI00103A143D|nr:uncharacterized protein LOC114365409 [Ostrinia furnacalis]